MRTRGTRRTAVACIVFAAAAGPYAGGGLLWGSATRLDSGGGACATLYYATNGNLRVFYSVTGAVQRMVVRRRRRGEEVFGGETNVYNNARSVGIHDTGTGQLDLAVANASSAVVLLSTNEGATWVYQKNYANGNNTGIFPSYLPLFLTPDGADLRMVYGYMYDTHVFGAHAQVYQVLRTSGVWQAAGVYIDDGEPCGVFEDGDEVCVGTSDGILFSANNGASYFWTGATSAIPEQLKASDITQGADGFLYLLHSYSYGPMPTNQYLKFTWSTNHGATWRLPQTEIVWREEYMFAPHFTLDGDRMVVVWQYSPIPNQHQHIQCRVSEDRGLTWGPVETIVSLTGSDEFLADGALDIASFDGTISLVYAVSDGGTRKGVYIMEAFTPRIRAVSCSEGQVHLGVEDLTAGLTSLIERATALSPGDWSEENRFLAQGRMTNIPVAVCNEVANAFYRVKTP